MPSTTVGHTLTAVALGDPQGPRLFPQLIPATQFAPVVIVETSSTICMTVHSPTATATSLHAESSLGMPTTSLAPLAPTTACAVPMHGSHLKKRTKHYRISLGKSILTRHVEVPILGRE